MEKIDIETGPVAFTSAGIADPKIGPEGKFSLWFLAALALAEGNITLDKFTDEKVNDPRLTRLMKKINAKLDRRLNLGAKVKVTMKDGSAYKGELATPKGNPANPLRPEEIETKFRDTASLAIPQGNIDLLIDRIKILEELADTKEIMALARSSKSVSPDGSG